MARSLKHAQMGEEHVREFTKFKQIGISEGLIGPRLESDCYYHRQVLPRPSQSLPLT